MNRNQEDFSSFDKEEQAQRNKKTTQHHHQDHPIVKVITEHNIDSVLKKIACPTLECLVRLRKYQLIKAIDPNPEGGYLIVLDPVSTGRTKVSDW